MLSVLHPEVEELFFGFAEGVNGSEVLFEFLNKFGPVKHPVLNCLGVSNRGFKPIKGCPL
jgi:hypothetical protein